MWVCERETIQEVMMFNEFLNNCDVFNSWWVHKLAGDLMFTLLYMYVMGSGYYAHRRLALGQYTILKIIVKLINLTKFIFWGEALFTNGKH